ncbi:glutamate--tRNA ligase [uncultured Nisaea sp.]|jgi:glutamyl-tRNA synthetase|uniref:glutamate--tRNA ligase n=1 Tax=uncultured Nisaea sp. TaxID=538215 RepID=UPI0030ED30C8|tara:strand:+ start:74 stop:1468 length:1395 start_codon:yes stop_codon:yes gene_type:complete
MSVVTRFAPSPTGFLHIGGARTALYNWLYARHTGGKYLVRIEDTDKARSTPEAVQAIFDGLAWLGLLGDEEPVYQSAQLNRHAEVAKELVAKGRAYYCYCTPEELQTMREEAKAAGKPMRYNGMWRDRDPSEAPAGVDPVVRLKAPLEGETTLVDHIQGEVTVQNEQLDDFVLLRGDGTPTYMLSVVVDDHDMGITHVLRGDDHLNNAFRQAALYRAMEWDVPEFGHIPLIHGADGAKLSKRHGALGVDAYREMGYLPETVKNYLLRLGWGHGDDEIISSAQAVEWFTLEAVGRSPSRFDLAKLENLNGHYIREADDSRLTDLVIAGLGNVDETGQKRILKGMDGLKQRAKTIVELTENAAFYTASVPLNFTEKAQNLLTEEALSHLTALTAELEAMPDWNEEAIEQAVRTIAEKADIKLGKLAQPLRAALTGSTVSPGIFEVAAVLERAETLARLKAICGTAQ